jgi:hypothetical protein
LLVLSIFVQKGLDVEESMRKALLLTDLASSLKKTTPNAKKKPIGAWSFYAQKNH